MPSDSLSSKLLGYLKLSWAFKLLEVLRREKMHHFFSPNHKEGLIKKKDKEEQIRTGEGNH